MDLRTGDPGPFSAFSLDAPRLAVVDKSHPATLPPPCSTSTGKAIQHAKAEIARIGGEIAGQGHRHKAPGNNSSRPAIVDRRALEYTVQCGVQQPDNDREARRETWFPIPI